MSIQFIQFERRPRKSAVAAAFFFCLVIFVTAGTSPADDSLTYLKSLKIEDLLKTEVTTVSKKPEKLSDATAAVFVITAEDIRRAGARSIPEALRMAPGIQVSQIDASKWAITSRGFNDTFSNKLLVMIDGRSVYTPLFSGVFWDAQDTFMEDIERIEVIRGPGAALWGANAVNGVINIITKSAQETQGTVMTVGTGTHERYSAAVRYGDRLGVDGAWRIYAKGFERGPYKNAAGRDAEDEWDTLRGGFRMDMDVNASDAITFQGDIYSGAESQTASLPATLTTAAAGPKKYSADLSGGNLLSRWRRSFGDQSDVSLQLYYNRTVRNQVVLKETRDTVDLDFQYRFQLTGRQEVIWGLGYRYKQDDTEPGAGMQLIPADRSDQLFSAFLQDELTLKPDTWWLMLGSKFEHNDYTGYEFQPNLRLRWKPGKLQTAWAAVSRAVRTPSRSDHDLRFNTEVGTVPVAYPPYSAPSLTALFGSDDFQSEELTAYELGYRWQPRPILSFDLSAFYNQYDNLRTIETDYGAARWENDPQPSHILIPVFIDNKMEGETYGFELVTTWQPLPFWKLTAGYTRLQMDLRTDADSTNPTAVVEAGYSPVNQIQLKSYLDLPNGWSLDTELYYVDELSEMQVPAFTRLDIRLGWQVNANLEASLTFENLLDDQHPEFGDRFNIISSQVPRQIFGQLIWRY